MTQFMYSQRLPAIDLTTSPPCVKSIDNEDNEWLIFGMERSPIRSEEINDVSRSVRLLPLIVHFGVVKSGAAAAELLSALS